MSTEDTVFTSDDYFPVGSGLVSPTDTVGRETTADTGALLRT